MVHNKCGKNCSIHIHLLLGGGPYHERLCRKTENKLMDYLLYNLFESVKVYNRVCTCGWLVVSVMLLRNGWSTTAWQVLMTSIVNARILYIVRVFLFIGGHISSYYIPTWGRYTSKWSIDCSFYVLNLPKYLYKGLGTKIV